MYIYFIIIILHYFKLQVRISFTWYDAFDKGSLWGYRKSCKYNNIIMYSGSSPDTIVYWTVLLMATLAKPHFSQLSYIVQTLYYYLLTGNWLTPVIGHLFCILRASTYKSFHCLYYNNRQNMYRKIM